MKVKVGISNRHVHLTMDAFKELFKDTKLEVVRELSQHGEFASNLFVNIKTGKSVIEHVRVVGPIRKYNQVEITKTDAYKLGINPPVRMSGDLEGSETVTLYTDLGSITLENSCIIAARHIHATPLDKETYHLKDKMKAIIDTEKPGVIKNVLVKTSDTYTYELHLDTDDANAFMLKNGDIVEIEEDI